MNNSFLVDPDVNMDMDIDSSQFRRNLAHFIDQQKPDPLVRRQLQSLHLEWKQTHGDNGGDGDGAYDDHNNNTSPDGGNNKNENQVDFPTHSTGRHPSSSSPSSSSSFLREGTLTMIGEYVTISLHCKCTWMIIDAGTCAASTSDKETSTRTRTSKGGDGLNAQIGTRTGGTIRRCQMNFQLWVSTAFTLKTAWNKVLLHKDKEEDNEKGKGKDEGGEGHGESIQSKRPSKMDRKEKKAQDKLRSGMVERMKKDVYIRRLFVDKDTGTDAGTNVPAAASSTSISTSKNSGILLCEANIQFDQAPAPTSTESSMSSAAMAAVSLGSDSGSNTCTGTLKMTNLEERVYVAEEALEGVRRSLFSHMEDNISVVEFILDLPFLPRNTVPFTGGSGSSMTSETEKDTGSGSGSGSEIRLDVERGTWTHKKNGKNDVQSDKNKLGNMLAERVVMRVLEDVMFDQCEKEGEDELLEDLNIGGNDNGGGGGDGDGDGDESDWIVERGRNKDNGSSRKGKKQKHKS